ncbi:unnamed protein product [Hymenolepis diminuta]|uniref:Uncharacterized protein n=1 Tax=Hymenolepis diminuta TaxID=6216 RepID=A0A564YD86_HYMDI|nr:unnamed protein product [Hymenolepis diminuta]
MNKHCVSLSCSPSSIRKAGSTSDDSCRDTADSAIFGTSPAHTVPSFSSNLPVHLKHTYNYVLTRVLIQVTIIKSLSNTHTYRLSLVRHTFLRSLLSSTRKWC